MKATAAFWGLCVVMQGADVSKQVSMLDREDGAKLEQAAVAIAKSGDAAAIEQLAAHFTKQSFLSRLDRGETDRVSGVFQVLAEHPSQAVEHLCTRLAFNTEFNSVPVRVNYLLNALAAVRPTSEAGAEVFSETGRAGYLEVNGPLLAVNGSPRALAVLEELLSDLQLDAAQRVSTAHWSLLPVRTHAEIIAMCARLLTPGRLSADVETAIAESLFDYRAREWFGVRRDQPRPAPWNSADARARDLLRKLGTSLLARRDLDESLRAAINRTLEGL